MRTPIAVLILLASPALAQVQLGWRTEHPHAAYPFVSSWSRSVVSHPDGGFVVAVTCAQVVPMGNVIKIFSQPSEVVRLTADGQTLWSTVLPYTERVEHLAVDGQGAVVLGFHGVTSAGGYRVARLDPSGALQWSVDLFTAGVDQTLALGAGASIVVAGDTVAGPDNDVRVVALSASGAILWDVTAPGPAAGDDHAEAVAVHASGRVVVAGSSSDASGAPVAHGVWSFDAAGQLLWSRAVPFAGSSTCTMRARSSPTSPTPSRSAAPGRRG